MINNSNIQGHIQPLSIAIRAFLVELRTIFEARALLFPSVRQFVMMMNAAPISLFMQHFQMYIFKEKYSRVTQRMKENINLYILAIEHLLWGNPVVY